MSRIDSHLWEVILSVSAVVSCGMAVQSSAQVPDKPMLGLAEVTASDVYLRSGPSLNHYTITKLNAGDRVTVVGETGEWFEIAPPVGVFSLISGDYVDTADEKTGMVNGDNVRVRAGSLLNKNKYTVQALLSKGAAVRILGRNADGFLRIEPPKGATLWVNRSFLEFVPEHLRQLEAEMAAPAMGQPPAAAPEPSAVTRDTAPKTPRVKETTPFDGLPITSHRADLLSVDVATRKELRKPVVERRFDPMIERYRTIAAQSEDEVAQRYAEARITQLTDMASLVDTIRGMRIQVERTESKRRELMSDRAGIRTTLPPIPSGIDVQGELRVSALYPIGSSPRRFRLVDATGPIERTICYVEIPADSNIEVDRFLGRYVGVQASATRLQKGGVDPVPIYIAKRLTMLQDAGANKVGNAGG